MKSFEYERAQSLQDAAALKTAAENAEFMAGGTDLLGKIKKEILPVPTSVVVDIKGLEEAKGVELKDGVLSIGALTTLAGLCENETVGKTFPGLAEAAHSVATPIIRNAGTIGGNICQDVRCWFYRYPNEAAGRLNCARKCGDECYASTARTAITPFRRLPHRRQPVYPGLPRRHGYLRVYGADPQGRLGRRRRSDHALQSHAHDHRPRLPPSLPG